LATLPAGQLGFSGERYLPSTAARRRGCFAGAVGPSRRQTVGYRQFACAAPFCHGAAVTPSLAGAALEVGDERFDSRGMRQLYEAADYPLGRRAPGWGALTKAKETCNGARLPKKQSGEEEAQDGEAQAGDTNIAFRARSGHGQLHAYSQEKWAVALQ
jgi:hypothetical protein